MATTEVLYIENDNLLRLSGLRDAANGTYLNGASVSVTLMDAATSTNIVGETWPLTMSYINDSDGVYQATLPYDLLLQEQQVLTAKLDADSGPGLRMSIRLPIIAIYRQGD